MRLAEVRELIRLQRPELDPVQRVIARCHSVEDVREAARRRLPRAVFDYVDGGADDEDTVAANRTALRQWAFQPQILHDVSAPDLSVDLFGQRLPAPLGLAPTGYTRMVNPVGETGVAMASAAYGVALRAFDRGLDVNRRPGRHRASPALVPVVRVARPERDKVVGGARRRLGLQSAGGVRGHPRGREPRPGRAQRDDHPASTEGADGPRYRPSFGVLDGYVAQPDAHRAQYDCAQYDCAQYDCAQYDWAQYDCAQYDGAQYDRAE